MIAFQKKAEEVVYRRPRPHVVEDDSENDDNDFPEPAVEPLHPAPVQLARPVALKVVCPIPQNAVEEFYEEAYRQGIAGTEIHAATAIAQDWHRKWTQQDEEWHTMPESNTDGVIPEHYAYIPIDRRVGAKNPSPEDLNSDYERKRMRVNKCFRSYSSISDSASPEDDSSSSPDPLLLPKTKRPAHQMESSEAVVPSNFADDDYQGPPPQTQGPAQASPPQTGLVRPVAVRVVRPLAIIPPEAADDLTTNGAIPQHIMESLRHGYSHQLSPLTIPSAVSSRRNPKALTPVEMDATMGSVPSEISHPNAYRSFLRALPSEVRQARCNLLHALAAAGGDVGQGAFDASLEVLSDYFVSLDVDTRPIYSVRPTEGLWLTLTKPSFFGTLGNNDNGDPMYTLGRMAFDMFSPTNLVCSLQGNFNIVKQVPHDARSELLDSVPPSLKDEVECGDTAFRTYDIVTAFTIEPYVPAYPSAPNKDVRRPIRGIMTTKGYTLPDPEVLNRHSVWITGGRIEPNDDPVDQSEWKRQFGLNPPKHSMGEKAKLLAIQMLMGATVPTEVREDGSLEYEFTRPLGGHGIAYVDSLYVDESLRIVRGHRGTVFVFSKQPDNACL